MKHEKQINLLYYLLIYLKAKVNKTTIELEFIKHPFRFSLLGISDILSNFNVSNAAYQVDIKEIPSLPFPIIAHTLTQEFVCIIGMKGNQLRCLSAEGTIITMKLDALAENFSGNVLTLETQGLKDYGFWLNKFKNENLQTTLLITIISLIILTAILLGNVSLSHPTLLLFLEILTGLSIAILLIIESFDNSNKLVNRICGISSKLNCKNILASSQAQLTPFLSLAECCLVYFSGSLIFLLINDQKTAAMTMLFGLTLLSLPFTIYSLFHQYKLRAWCLLCCVTIFLLWSEVITLWFQAALNAELINERCILFFILSFGVPIACWIAIKPLITARLELKNVKKELAAFKYNENIFKLSLSDEAKFELLDEQHVIVIGKSTSETVITIISNPFCRPCAEAHRLLNQWLNTGVEFKLQIVFALPTNEAAANDVSAHLNSLYRNGDKRLTSNAIHDWFEWGINNKTEWTTRYAIPDHSSRPDYTPQQQQWIDQLNLRYTPTILINGTKLPELYQLQDIRYMLLV